MKFATLVATALAVLATSSSALSLDARYRQQQQADQTLIGVVDKPIPGGSPVVICSPDPSQDLVIIDKVVISPNPPVAGQKLSIQASGTVLERIDDGATIDVVVKLGYIILLKKRFDFCEEIKNVDMTCPIEKGPINVVKEVDLPKEIPPGKFVVTANVFNAEDNLITCLKATVNFARIHS